MEDYLLPCPPGKRRASPVMFDIRDHPEVCEAINAVVNNGGIAEVKNEKRKGEDNYVVVEIVRALKTKKRP